MAALLSPDFAAANDLSLRHIIEENGRRNTISGVPLTRHTDIPPHALSESQQDSSAAVIPSSRQANSSGTSIDNTSRSSSPSNSSHTEGQLCICQKEPKIPRPRNAFILYRQHQHAAVVAQNPGLPNPDVSKIIGEQWRRLPDKKKDEWKVLAEEEKVRHSQQYPDYRYKPKRSGRFSGQNSISGPTPNPHDGPKICDKCGRKTVILPITTVSQQSLPAPVSAIESEMTGVHEPPARGLPQPGRQFQRIPLTQQTISPPHSARTRPYGEVFGQGPPRHDPRLQYTPAMHQNGTAVDVPDTKRRRFNGNRVYAPIRGLYHDFHYSPHDMMPRPNVPQQQPPPPPPQMQQTRFPHQQHERDPSLTLPPLQTITPRSRTLSQAIVNLTQKSGIEAMITSVPTLNKVKLLSQVSPHHQSSTSGSPKSRSRGAILAIEGMDAAAVSSMTSSLAEQLEREGKFAVRIFGGPNPYTLRRLSDHGDYSSNEGHALTVPGFLEWISQWHKVSREMTDYITTKPGFEQHGIKDTVMHDATTPPSDGTYITGRQISKAVETRIEAARDRTPESAVSPRTISQTAELSLRSPTTTDGRQYEPVPFTRPRSRIPAAALIQQEAMAKAKTEAEGKKKVGTQEQKNLGMVVVQLKDDTKEGDGSPSTNATSPPRQPDFSSNQQRGSITPELIPIAIVPHYQLTTVDLSSMAIPITDSYSPHSHWQWLATLWRGCTGPDVTIVIESAGQAEDNMVNANPLSSAGSANSQPRSQIQVQGHNQQAQAQNAQAHGTAHQQQQQHRLVPANANDAAFPNNQQVQAPKQGPGVDIRLHDHRAVVVRTEPVKEISPKQEHMQKNVSSEDSVLKSSLDGTEAWEKAKRRVGFEVEEFLRR